MLGFETIGNATLTVFDGSPVLSTDPWIKGSPYFGSWCHNYEISASQIENISKSKYIWFSHGHPDHLDSDSYEIFKDSIWLIPDHYGDRIYLSLKDRFNVIKIKSNTWFQISSKVRIKSYADWNQDAALIVDIDGKDCICNANDGSLLGWQNEIKKTISKFKNRFLLRLINWGDADMINFYDDTGNFIEPNQSKSEPLGLSYNYHMQKLNCNFAIPFSTFHQYSRSDSMKMNNFLTPYDKHFEGFDYSKGVLLDSHGFWDSEKDDYLVAKKNKLDLIISRPEDFGDIYSDELDSEDRKIVKNYFLRFSHLKKNFGNIILKVGGKEHNIRLSNLASSIKFEVPRNSLMKAVKFDIFDDLLIGNFMKTTLINVESLYPNFTPFVAKYGDNGMARGEDDLKAYFQYYKINSANYWMDLLRIKSEDKIRTMGLNDYRIFSSFRKIKRKYFC